MSWPPLYSRDRKGALIVWRVFAEDDMLIFEHGKADGKKIENKTRCKPTNAGRANHRTAEQQAEFEAQSAWDAKIKEGYQRTPELAAQVTVLLPMLAHPLEKEVRNKAGQVRVVRRDVTWPAWGQPKLNGLRGFAHVDADGSVRLVSRQGTPWTVTGHIIRDVAAIGQPGDIFDGELFIKGVPLQTLNSYVKAYSPGTELLEYHMYDMPRSRGSIDGVWEDRHAELNRRYSSHVTASLRLVQTMLCHSEAEARLLTNDLVMTQGYEGLIIRQAGRRYEFNTRTDSLIKFKLFTDSEFEVIDALPREYFDPLTGSSMTIVDKFVCRNDQAPYASFEVVPRGTMAQRAAWAQQPSSWQGQRLVVRYLERSISGIPQGNPVGIAFRLPDDMPTAEDEDDN